MATPTVLSSRPYQFTYSYLPISDLQVTTTEDPKTGKRVVDKVMVQDEPLQPTERFWTSLFARFGFNRAFFKYFDHDEVFNRIAVRESADRMRLCIERPLDLQPGEPSGTLLGVSSPDKPVVVYDELMELLGRYHGEGLTYANGVVESYHTPRAGGLRFEVKDDSWQAGDEFVNKFVMATPIDGYGSPNIYLSLLRTRGHAGSGRAASNGIVGYSKAFKAGLALGKATDDVGPSLTRALDGFGNEEGYAAIRQRIESAIGSWASVYETTTLYKLMIRLMNRRYLESPEQVPQQAAYIEQLLSHSYDGRGQADDDVIGSPVLKAFHRLTGDTSKLYGLANLDALSVKRQRTLPVRCTIYDVVNYATEVATHYATPEGSRELNAWVGNLIGSGEEYDMEGTKAEFDKFEDFQRERKGEAAAELADVS